jgi:hypothetical protein
MAAAVKFRSSEVTSDERRVKPEGKVGLTRHFFQAAAPFRYDGGKKAIAFDGRGPCPHRVV